MKTNDERVKFLRENPIFWSRLGVPDDSGSTIPEEKGRKETTLEEYFATDINRHKAMKKRGIKIHSARINLGWVGDGEYDYETADKALDMFFDAVPDGYFIPRINLNAPVEWCKAHPEDIFVYYNGPRTRDEILALVGTDAQDYHGFNTTQVKNGHRNIDGVIARQSFCSPRWRRDAGEALRRFVQRAEKRYGDKILGYHIAYGCCGETTAWGTWERDLNRRGDFGITAREEFRKYALSRGVENAQVPSPFAREKMEEVSLKNLFYSKEEDAILSLYSHFISDANSDAIEHFCAVSKSVAPQKPVGIFYGYVMEVSTSSHAGHLGFNRVLSCPDLDFLAGPKGYYRVDPKGPGYGQAIHNAMNRRKLWVDEIDNRTHLYSSDIADSSVAKDMSETRAVYWREFSKNISVGQGYWWMDLMGGWLDGEEIRSEIALLERTGAEIWRKNPSCSRICEVVIFFDERPMHEMRVVGAMHSTFMEKMGATIKESGAPIETYRVADALEMDLSPYKLIVFDNPYCVTQEEKEIIMKKARPDACVVWDYTAGIMANGYDASAVERLTGFKIEEYPHEYNMPEHENCPFPLIKVVETDGVECFKRYANGDAMIGVKKRGQGYDILNALPTDLTVEDVRRLYSLAGVHTFAPARCTVHQSDCFVFVLAGVDINDVVRMPSFCNATNIFTGEKYEKTDTLPLNLKAGNCVFYMIEKTTELS